MSEMDQCPVTYRGPSVPGAHGTRCLHAKPHPGFRHFAFYLDKPLSWWTEEEKQALRARQEKSDV